MDHEDNPQAKTNQGGGDMVRQPTDLMLIDLPTVLAEHIDLDVTIEEGQSQARPSMNMESRQEQEVTKESLTITRKQNRRLLQSPQTTEPAARHVICQTTLQGLERSAYCVFEHGNLENSISRHGILSQDLELAWRTLTEPTRPAPRSRVRQLFDSG